MLIKIYKDRGHDSSLNVKPSHLDPPRWLTTVKVINPASSMSANGTWSKIKTQKNTSNNKKYINYVLVTPQIKFITTTFTLKLLLKFKRNNPVTFIVIINVTD